MTTTDRKRWSEFASSLKSSAAQAESQNFHNGATGDEQQTVINIRSID
jgi:hypothetical protein